MSLGRAKFHINRCDESPLRGENADFWHVSKNNTGSFFLIISTVKVLVKKSVLVLPT